MHILGKQLRYVNIVDNSATDYKIRKHQACQLYNLIINSHLCYKTDTSKIYNVVCVVDHFTDASIS